MDISELDELVRLDREATAAPWNVAHFSDSLAMSAVAVVKVSGRKRFDAMLDWEPDEIIARCLDQSGELVNVDDHRWDENAELIAKMRNALLELIRLARVGLQSAKLSA